MIRALCLLIAAACAGCSAPERPVVAPTVHAAPHAQRDRDHALGVEIDRQLRRRFELYDNARLAAYVTRVGARVAASADCIGCRFTFRVIDDADPNAFAVPGGFVYVTRGILALLSSEAELAGVLGHEIGHVVARHAIDRWARERDPFAGERSAWLALAVHTRDNEREADSLGVAFAARAGYDPRGLSTALAALGELEHAGAHDSRPFDEHPATNARVARAALLAQAWSAGRVGAAAYLAAIDGIVVGDDPRRGYMDGRWYVRPDAGFRISLPAAWRVEVDGGALAARDPEAERGLVLVRTRYSSLAQARDATFDDGVRHDELAQRRIGGFPALAGPIFAAERAQPAGSIALILAGGRVYLAIVAGPRDVLASLAAIADPALAALAPRRMHVQRLARAATARGLAAADSLALFCELNRVAADARLSAGRVVKRVRRSATDEATPHLE